MAALKAFNAAMYFSDIKDGLYDKAKGFLSMNWIRNMKDQMKTLDIIQGFCDHVFRDKKETASSNILSGNGKLTY